MLSILYLLCSTFTVVLADPAASYWQAVQYFLARQFETEAFPDGPRLIAPGCPEPCNLLQFMSYTQSGTYGVSLVPGRQSSVGNNRWPSAAEAVRDMKENMKFGQKNKSPFHDWRRLWSDTILFQVADVNQGPDLRQQVNAMTDRVQEARRRLGDRGELERFLHDRDPSITLVKKPYQGPDGSFEDIDYEETVRNHPGFVKQFENYHLYVWTTDVPADRNARTPDQARLWSVKTHTPPIQAIIHSANRFHGDANCG